ncbi:DUF6911 family protein [Limnobaculum parvum]|uniref:Uncharacterized protein n=1 Tax=Limnobaculum parvum TaxID=2172103 RepID=A0A2Y9TVQ5_9GAMM|nr:hypothetical protein [Limnobaculum parvum]AWH87785.1 hypothetical protein HYN51_03940 [Limnobaculum parvum]
MIIEYELSIHLNNKYHEIIQPTWVMVKEYLNLLRGQSGSTHLRIINTQDIGPERLSVEGEGEYYLITLLEYNELGGDVRSFSEPKGGNNKILVNGDYWPDKQLTKDFDFVVAVFKEFFETGNVSKKYLN